MTDIEQLLTWQLITFIAILASLIIGILYLYKQDKRMIVFFVVGGPGAGKGTQCAKLHEIYPDIISLSTGQLLRRKVKEAKTPRAVEIGNQMKNGDLVDINATTELLQPEFERYRKEGKNVFIIDGFPRSIEILDHWNKGMSNNEYIMPFVIELDCPVHTMRQRLLARKRNDDTEKSINRRISVFENETAPVISIFKQKNQYIKVNSRRSKDAITDELNQLLRPYITWSLIKSCKLFPGGFDNECTTKIATWWIRVLQYYRMGWIITLVTKLVSNQQKQVKSESVQLVPK